MADEDEFDDNIDWSTVHLPSISASMEMPKAPMTLTARSAGGEARHRPSLPSGHTRRAATATVTAPIASCSGYAPKNGDALSFHAEPRMEAMTSTMGVGGSENAQALRRQIQELQSQLETKDERIFELEASAATSHAEASHRSTQAEAQAKKKIHLAEEDLRRMTMEAEKYKASWIRQKKRAAELAQRQSEPTDRGNRTRIHLGPMAAADGKRASFGTWDLPVDMEVRKVTPSISHEDRDNTKDPPVTAEGDMFESPASKISGTKRKCTDVEDVVIYSSHRTLQFAGGDSVGQCLAKHLINREEMGCYSLPRSGDANMSSSGTLNSEEEEDKGTSGRAPISKGQAARPRGSCVEKETRWILRQMAEAPESEGSLSASGLVRLLLERLNALFRRTKGSRTGARHGHFIVDEDGNPTTELENGFDDGARNEQSSLRNPESEYESVVTGTLAEDSRTPPMGDVMYATDSWRAALHLLHLLQEILLLSGHAREDLRRWCYHSRQLVGGGEGSPPHADSPHDARDMRRGGQRADSCPRIEGLPPKKSSDGREALWTPGCRSSSRRRSLWDPTTMAMPCNTFFEILVGLMTKNVTCLQNATATKKSPGSVPDQPSVELVQLNTIDLVSTLMSDASPYDHAKDGIRETPYLWKFWFDALLPSYSSAPTATGSLSSRPCGDFLSPWETANARGDCLLGSGRTHATRLSTETHNDAIKQSELGALKHPPSSASDRRKGQKKNSEVSSIHNQKKRHQERLSILIKRKILQFLSHLVLCSSSVKQIMYKRKETCPLAKRVLAALLDCLEEDIVPSLSSGMLSNVHLQDADEYLRLCSTCIQFLVIMSGSNEGLRMLSVQMRLESEEGDPSRWSQSAIGCVASVLDSTLFFAMEIKKYQSTVLQSETPSSSPTPASVGLEANAVVDQCISFFKTVLLSVNQQRSSSSKAVTFLALISEHRTIFLSCLQKILSCQVSKSTLDPLSLLHVSEALRQDVHYLFEEIVIDEEEEIREST